MTQRGAGLTGATTSMCNLIATTEAEAAYREAIARDPKDASPWNSLGNLLQDHLQRYEEAEAAYREAIARDPQNVAAWNSLGSLFCDHLHRFDDAAAVYARAIELDPTEEMAHQNLIFLHRDFWVRRWPLVRY